MPPGSMWWRVESGSVTPSTSATRERRLFPIYERSLLQPEVEIEGPAIVREPTSVTIIHSDQSAVLDHLGNLVVK